MLIGHYSAALAAKAIKPELPLWQLFVAAQLVDMVWAVLVFANVELMHIDPSLKSNPLDLYYMPFTHSLLATVIWTAASLLCLWLAFNQRYTHALLLAAVVGSHWFLDFLVHRPDLLIYGDIKVGLALWNFPWLAMTLELGLFAGSAFWLVAVLKRNGTNNGQTIRFLLVAMAAFQIASYLAPMPTEKTMILASALAIYLVIPALAYWLEVHRFKNIKGQCAAN